MYGVCASGGVVGRCGTGVLAVCFVSGGTSRIVRRSRQHGPELLSDSQSGLWVLSTRVRRKVAVTTLGEVTGIRLCDLWLLVGRTNVRGPSVSLVPPGNGRVVLCGVGRVQPEPQVRPDPASLPRHLLDLRPRLSSTSSCTGVPGGGTALRGGHSVGSATSRRPHAQAWLVKEVALAFNTIVGAVRWSFR